MELGNNCNNVVIVTSLKNANFGSVSVKKGSKSTLDMTFTNSNI